MKMLKRLYRFIPSLFLVSIVLTMAGCEQDWEKEFTTSTLKQPITANVQVSDVKDSSAIINFTLSGQGRIYIVVLKGDDQLALPDPNKMLNLSTPDALLSAQFVLNDPLSKDTIVTGLEQNTSYKVFALPVNTDGVLGTIATTDAFTTSDTYNPILNSTTPAKSSSASQELGFPITLTFDEPVVLLDGYTMQMGYRDAVTGVISWLDVPKDSIMADGKNVTIKQPLEQDQMINGQYVFLTIGANTFADRAGNKYEGITSGISGGYLVGLYWRFTYVDREATVFPEGDLITAPATFQIKLKYTYPLSTGGYTYYENSFVVVRIYDENISIDYKIDASLLTISADTLIIDMPVSLNYGKHITFYVAKGTFWDKYGNDIAEIAFGDYDWLVSYNYQRSLIIGNYSVEAVSYFGGSSTFSNVTVTAKAGTTDGVIITGLFDSPEPIEGVFNGDLATLTIAGGQSFGDLYGDGSEVVFDDGSGDMQTPVVGTIQADGTINLDWWGGVIVGGTYNGYYWDYYESSVWTKTAKGIKSTGSFVPALKKLTR